MIAAWLGALLACGPSTPDAHMEAAAAATDPERAAAHLEAACQGGRVDACVARAASPVGDPVARAAAAAAACEAGEAAGCAARTEAPGDRWDQLGCDAGDVDACRRAADAAVDLAAAARYGGQACHAGAADRCWLASDAWRRLGDTTRAAGLLGVRCAAGVGLACALEAELVAEGRAAAACAEDPAACDAPCAAGRLDLCRADRLRVGCEGGDGAACARLGQLAVDRDEAAADAALWQGCAAHDAWACLLLADRVRAGRPLPPGARGDADWLHTQACDLQLDYACASAP